MYVIHMIDYRSKRTPESDILQAYCDYREGSSLKSVAGQYKIGARALWGLFNRRGWACRPRGYNIIRTYAVNEDFFNTINTEEKAYWLGFIMADGCIADKERVLKLNLAIKDKSHLEKLKASLSSQHPIYEFSLYNKIWKQTSRMAKMNIGSKKLCSALIKSGCSPRKTTRLQMPTLDPKLTHHFIRGYFDGDGCICCVERAPYVSMIGNIGFIQECQNVFIQNCGLSKTKLKKRHNAGDQNVISLVYCGRGNAKKIGKYLYSGATVFMDRKKEKFDALDISKDVCTRNQTFKKKQKKITSSKMLRKRR